MAEESLGIKAGRAALWQIAGGGWQTLVRLGASIYLARALKPSDFGLFGMALLYQGLLVTALSLGFGTGLIVKKELTEDDLSTAFWLSCTVRFIIFLVVFITAPLAAYFWKEPRVESIIRVISLTLLVQIIGIIPGTLATKHLQFKKINIIRAIAILLESTTAIILVAFTDLTYWALVIGMILNTLFYNITLWISSGCWMPKINFHKESFRYLFRFGFYTWFLGIINYLRQNIDYFLVGKLLNAHYLGLYEFAYRIPNLVVERISSPLAGVFFPALAKSSTNNDFILDIYSKYLKIIILICFIPLFILLSVADIFVPIFWGSQWTIIIFPMKILCLATSMRCIFQATPAIFYIKNKPEILSKFAVAILIFSFMSVGMLGYHFGLNGVAFGMLFATLPSCLIFIYIIKVLLKTDILLFIKSLVSPLTISLCGMISSFLFKKIFLFYNFPLFMTLVLSITLGFSFSFFMLIYCYNNFFNELKYLFFAIIKLKKL